MTSASSLLRTLASRAPLSGEAREQLANSSLPEFRTLLELAGEHFLLGAVLVRLERDGVLDALTAEVAPIAREQLRKLRRAVVAQDMERERILALLRRADVTAVLLKGAALRVALYADPVERHTGDLDILVARTDLALARDALGIGGYRVRVEGDEAVYTRHHFHLGMEGPTGLVVELHWALTEPAAPSSLDAEQVRLSSVLHARTQGAPLRVPRWEHMVLHLALQNGAEPQRLYSRCVDVDRIVAADPHFDWGELVTCAGRSRARTPLWFTLRTAQRLFGAPVPSDVLRALEPSRLTRAHFDRLAFDRDIGVAMRDVARVQLSQLWSLLGDHAPGRSLDWLLHHTLIGPRERTVARSRLGQAHRDGARLLQLARDHLRLYRRQENRGAA